MKNLQPLIWPPHFPPTGQWKRFFIGIRLLGPDISFFQELKQLQASRTEAAMNEWLDERERRSALTFGKIICRYTDWKNPFFIPDDKAIVIVYGPRLLECEESPIDLALSDFEKEFGPTFDRDYWSGILDWGNKNATFGELIKKVAR